MPKATLVFSDSQFLAVMNRSLRIPGKVESIVQQAILRQNMGSDDEWAIGLDNVWSLLIDFNPIVDYSAAFDFDLFAHTMFGANLDLKKIEDVEDYAVIENLAAAASTYDHFSFDWTKE